jgi:perosamine synthetase
MIPAFRPTIKRADMDAVLTRLAEDSIGSGVLAAEFSQKLARYLNRRSGISMRSYGQAFSAAIAAFGLEPGARVGCSVLAPDRVRRLILKSGLEPVPIDSQKTLPILPSPLDVDYEAMNLAALYVDTRLGYIPDIENLIQLKIPVLEDVSEGLGGNNGSVMAGSVGDMTLIGLEPEHIITTGGGAVVVTSNSRRVGLLGAATDGTEGELPLPDMNAALGLTQLKNLERFIERRRELAARFLRVVQRTRHTLPVQTGEAESVFYGLPLVVDSSPREIEQYARTHGVTVTRAFPDVILHGLAAANDTDEITDESIPRLFPNAVSIAGRTVLFPLFPTLTKSDQDRIERVLATIP